MKVGKIICETPVFPSFHDPPEISQQIISISQINAGVCAKNGRIAITAKITAAATCSNHNFSFHSIPAFSIMFAEYFVFVIISFFLKTLYPMHRNTSNFSSPGHFQTAFKNSLA